MNGDPFTPEAIKSLHYGDLLRYERSDADGTKLSIVVSVRYIDYFRIKSRKPLREPQSDLHALGGQKGTEAVVE
jgi:hypothetical protein